MLSKIKQEIKLELSSLNIEKENSLKQGKLDYPILDGKSKGLKLALDIITGIENED